MCVSVCETERLQVWLEQIKCVCISVRAKAMLEEWTLMYKNLTEEHLSLLSYLTRDGNQRCTFLWKRTHTHSYTRPLKHRRRLSAKLPLAFFSFFLNNRDSNKQKTCRITCTHYILYTTQRIWACFPSVVSLAFFITNLNAKQERSLSLPLAFSHPHTNTRTHLP